MCTIEYDCVVCYSNHTRLCRVLLCIHGPLLTTGLCLQHTRHTCTTTQACSSNTSTSTCTNTCARIVWRQQGRRGMWGCFCKNAHDHHVPSAAGRPCMIPCNMHTGWWRQPLCQHGQPHGECEKGTDDGAAGNCPSATGAAGVCGGGGLLGGYWVGVYNTCCMMTTHSMYTQDGV